MQGSPGVRRAPSFIPLIARVPLAALFLVPGVRALAAVATVLAQRFREVDPGQYANQPNHFLKDLAVIGGVLLVATHGPGRLAFDSR